MKIRVILIYCICFTASNFGHPTGDMVFTGNKLLWSYVCPVGNIQHNACLMVWDRDQGVRPWVTSEHPASDWMISPADSESVYLIERYYNQTEQSSYIRILHSIIEEEPTEIIPWFKSEYRIGENGFTVKKDGKILFVNYPNLYILDQDLHIQKAAEWSEALNSIRNTIEGDLILQSDSIIWKTDKDLNVQRKWENLIEDPGMNPPFGGNKIFDADYENGNLYIAYWGKRKFEVITDNKRKTLISFTSPWIPHHIAVNENEVYMLSSTIAPGVTDIIEPSLWLKNNEGFELLWGDSAKLTSSDDQHKLNQFNLHQNYSNPFNPSTIINYEIGTKSEVNLDVYNITGEKVGSLVNSVKDPGQYNVEFRAKGLASGVYFYRLNVNSITSGKQYKETKKMVLVR